MSREISELKIKVISQVKPILEDSKINPYQNQWNDAIELFFELIKYPENEIGFYNQFLNSLEEILFQAPDYNELVSFTNYLERYLALLANLLNMKLQEQSSVLRLFKLLKLRTDFRVYFSRDNIEKYRHQPELLEHFCRAHCTRNENSHANEDTLLPEWANNDAEIILSRNSILAVIIYATCVHYDELKKKVEQRNNLQQPNVKPYLSEVVREFEEWKRRFVMLQTIEKVNLYAIEKTDKKPRHGDIDQVWKTLQEKQLMLIGDAGTGKTTTLQYLTLEMAKHCFGETAPKTIPIYLALGSLGSALSLLQAINEKLPFEQIIIDQWLKDGKISLFLDGLNEVRKDYRQQVYQDIQLIIQRYPQCQLLVSGRESYQFNLKSNKVVSIFEVKPLDQARVKEFLEKNADQKIVRQLILDKIEHNKHFARFFSIPFMLFMLIQVVKEDQKLPENIADLMDRFMWLLYERERSKDTTFQPETFHSLLVHLAFQIFSKHGENPAIPYEEILNILSQKKADNGFEVDLAEILKIATQLSILVKSTHRQYSFCHQQYLDYYAEQAL